MPEPHDASAARRDGWHVIAPFVLAVATLALLGVVSADLLSAARAYVGGESLWSKSRALASQHLRHYLQSGDPAAIDAFERALAVPLGDRRARLELDRAGTDMAVVHDGFVQGGNHPDDVAGMARLYTWLGRVPAIARAIEVWAAADLDIDQMAAVAREARRQGPGLEAPGRAGLLTSLDAIDQRLMAHEREFSRRLGEASRQSAGVAMVATVALALLLTALAAVFALRTWRRLAASESSQRAINARWQMAADAVLIGVFEWDLRSQTMDVDPLCLALHGLPADGLRQRRTGEMFRQIEPDDRVRVLDANRKGLARTGPWQVRFRTRRPDGGSRHVELDACRSPDPHIVIGLVRDVSADELAAQLRRDKEAAEQASAAKTAFLSRASHELRTPLNAVLGFAQMMELDPDERLGPVQSRRLAFVRQGGEHLLRLVNDILDLSSAEQGALGVALADVDLGAALRSVAGLLEPLARERGIALALEVAPLPAPVRADRTRLEQVLVNLLSNAIKYNRPDGHIWITAAPGEPGWAAVTVRDDGVGMTDEQMRSLFQPFNRLGAERGAVEGAGLGLVVSRSLVERFGGRLEVQSAPRVGTTMRVCLPLGATAAPADDALSRRP
jgi:signal transduction histidine kinase